MLKHNKKEMINRDVCSTKTRKLAALNKGKTWVSQVGQLIITPKIYMTIPIENRHLEYFSSTNLNFKTVKISKENIK
jgi:hypothetical protein